MDEYAMLFAMILATIARVEPDWEKHEFWAHVYVLTLGVGVAILTLFIFWRTFD